MEDECPISLTPIAELAYEPFVLEEPGAEEEGEKAKRAVRCYFDGAFLAQYLLSAAEFINPVTRRPLTRAE